MTSAPCHEMLNLSSMTAGQLPGCRAYLLCQFAELPAESQSARRLSQRTRKKPLMSSVHKHRQHCANVTTELSEPPAAAPCNLRKEIPAAVVVVVLVVAVALSPTWAWLESFSDSDLRLRYYLNENGKRVPGSAENRPLVWPLSQTLWPERPRPGPFVQTLWLRKRY